MPDCKPRDIPVVCMTELVCKLSVFSLWIPNEHLTVTSLLMMLGLLFCRRVLGLMNSAAPVL